MSTAIDIYPGRTLGRYELLLPIAQGGTASVWAAKMRGPRGFEKIVAIKTVLADLADDDLFAAESMFLDEARLVARIRHPNVVEVLDLGEDDGVLFIVMEWIEGESLSVLTREAKAKGGLPVPFALRIAARACAGLHAAHELRDDAGALVNLVHRDVSPQNILVTYDGSVKVIDFGVAKAATNQAQTNVGQLKGKVLYMAPEQAFGNKVDRRTDVFAMGIVLYQLVTGTHPFRADNEFATLARIRDKKEVAPARSIVKDLPEEVDRVIMKALSKDPSGRYASMLDLRRAIEEAGRAPPDVDTSLSAFIKDLLSRRAERKDKAIREALKLSNERSASATKGRPIEPAPRLSIFEDDEVRPAKIAEEVPSTLPSGVTPPPRTAPVRVDVVEPTPPPAPAPPVAAPAPPVVVGAPIRPESWANGGPSAGPPSSVDPSLTDFRRRRTRIGLLIAGVAIALAIVIAIVASSSPDPNAPIEVPTKRPW